MRTLLEHVTPLLLICFRIQLKVLVITCKASCGMGAGYPRNCLPPPNRIGPPHSLWIPSSKLFGLVGPGQEDFSAVAPTFWNILPLEARSAPTLMAFQGSLGSGGWPRARMGHSGLRMADGVERRSPRPPHLSSSFLAASLIFPNCKCFVFLRFLIL